MNALGVSCAERGDFVCAIRWYSRAADRGNAVAMCNLAAMNGNGRGFEKDDRQAFQWYQMCAEAGNAHGMALVSFAYDPDPDLTRNCFIHVRKDAAQSFWWALNAATFGHRITMRNLARMYGRGQGTAQNSAEANRWDGLPQKERDTNPRGAEGNCGTPAP